jgi:hypothetical protein
MVAFRLSRRRSFITLIGALAFAHFAIICDAVSRIPTKSSLTLDGVRSGIMI